MENIEKMYNFNKFQTEINETLKNSIPKEVYDNLLEYISTVKKFSSG